jgi:hypothetical protein
MPPEGIDSLDAKSLKGLVVSLLTRIDELAGQNKALLARIDELLARIAKLEGRAGKSPKTRRTRRCRSAAPLVAQPQQSPTANSETFSPWC